MYENPHYYARFIKLRVCVVAEDYYADRLESANLGEREREREAEFVVSICVSLTHLSSFFFHHLDLDFFNIRNFYGHLNTRPIDRTQRYGPMGLFLLLLCDFSSSFFNLYIPI